MTNKEQLLRKLRLNSDATDGQLKLAFEKLRHTYELVAISSNDEDIKKMAENKLRELTALAETVIGAVEIDMTYNDEYDEIIKAAHKLLENSRASVNERRIMLEKLNKTTMTSENYYLQTLIHLEINNGFPGCKEAKKTIENAIVIEPQNEAFLALREGIDSVIQAKIAYDEEQLRIQQLQLQEQQEKQKAAEAEARAQQRRAICGGIFECICGCIGGIFECVCSCCSCCDDCC